MRSIARVTHLARAPSAARRSSHHFDIKIDIPPDGRRDGAIRSADVRPPGRHSATWAVFTATHAPHDHPSPLAQPRQHTRRHENDATTIDRRRRDGGVGHGSHRGLLFLSFFKSRGMIEELLRGITNALVFGACARRCGGIARHEYGTVLTPFVSACGVAHGCGAAACGSFFFFLTIFFCKIIYFYKPLPPPP